MKKFGFSTVLLVAVLFISLVSIPSFSNQTVLINKDVPDSYTVVRGDTLWDISAVFLQDPWMWPEIWHANQQIDNPHLIYPGDIISLVYINGVPQLKIVRSREVKLSPEIRSLDHGDAITQEVCWRWPNARGYRREGASGARSARGDRRRARGRSRSSARDVDWSASCSSPTG